MSRRLAGAAATLALALAAAAPAVAKPLPVGSADGVRIVQGRAGVAIVFTRRVGNGTRPAGYPTAAQLTSGPWARELRRDGTRIVALAAPTDTPPAGRVGYWSDGGASATVVTLSAAGRRLYIEVGPDDLLRTNVARAIFAAVD